MFSGSHVVEMGLILVIALVVFGPQKLPEVARTVGTFMHEIRKATSGIEDAIMRSAAQDDDGGDEDIITRYAEPAPEPAENDNLSPVIDTLELRRQRRDAQRRARPQLAPRSPESAD
jgi:sec-independent protein translocase protein TatA